MGDEWRHPATLDDAAEVAAFVIELCEPTASAERVGLLTTAIASREYSRAELLLIARETPYATMYGPHLRLDVVEEIVASHRTLRRKAGRHGSRWTEDERNQAVDRRLFVETDFYRSGQDNRTGRDLFKLRSEARVAAGCPVSAILDAQRLNS